ncbi:MAG TPA: PQQ-binding-like beta-propeller repeat protein [Pirellulaceae bacterium]|nr:PQQ-binding-like beta-propeller repeat protein [Pirellulaceae bacterium]HMO91681.1 PQQ-binding-like beta-propeller repeat protein [Pirellulaceae bacterium]HMP68378.1 PQQ-binding-like beta-propeller repeat protein [Pirellulaceae bacterium]
MTSFGPNLDESNLVRLWHVDLGPSYSGPIVVGDLVYTTETRDEKYEIVYAFNRQTGEKVWEAKWEGAMKVPFFARRNGDWIRSTPAYDDGLLYVAGMKDVLVCLDARKGTEVWKLDFPTRFRSPNPDFGFVCSPLVDGNHVYVQAGAAVFKLNKRDGNVIWKSAEDAGGMWGSAFSSPMLVEIHGVRQLVVQTRAELMGIDDHSGKILWRKEIPSFRGMNILTPTIVNNQIFTSSYGGQSFMFELDLLEGVWQIKEKWQNNIQGYMSSPVVVGDSIYLHLRNKRFCCLDWKSGRENWRSAPSAEYASLVASGNQILSLNHDGKLLLIKATPEGFEVEAERTISGQETWAHLAVSGNQLFIRELKGLAVYELKSAQESPDSQAEAPAKSSKKSDR